MYDVPASNKIKPALERLLQIWHKSPPITLSFQDETWGWSVDQKDTKSSVASI